MRRLLQQRSRASTKAERCSKCRRVFSPATERNIPFRVATRRAEEASEQKVYLDFLQPASLQPALREVEKIFLIRPPEISDAKKYFFPFLQIAQEQGVKRIVFLSVMGAERIQFIPHAKIEHSILASHIPYTFLRPSFFTQNIVTQHLDELLQENTLYIPAGKGKTSFIDTRDIGEVGALCLLDERHMRKAYTLTGNEALTYYDVARIFTAELGRSITYARPSLWQFRKRMLAKGVPSSFVTVMLGIYFTSILGMAKKVTPELELILGRPPRTVRDFAHDYREQLSPT